MKKIKYFTLCLLLLFCFTITSSKVYAINTNNLYTLTIVADNKSTDTTETSSSSSSTSSNVSTSSSNCPVFGDPEDNTTVAYYMQSAFNIMKFAGILLAIIFTVIDLFKAITTQDDAALKKVGSKTIKRVLYAILIFFLPDLINLLLHLVGLYGTCGIS